MPADSAGDIDQLGVVAASQGGLAAHIHRCDLVVSSGATNTSRLEYWSVLAGSRESDDLGFIARLDWSSILTLNIESSGRVHQKEPSLGEARSHRADDFYAANIAQIGGEFANVANQCCWNAKGIRRGGIQDGGISKAGHEDVNRHELVAPVESGSTNSIKANFGVN